MIERNNNEDFLTYGDRLLTNRKSYDLDKIEVYEMLYKKQASSDHVRKCLSNLADTIRLQKESVIDNNINKDIDNENLENDLNKKYRSTTEINKDGTFTSDKLLVMSEEDSKDVNYLLKAHKYSISAWELISARNNIWNVHSKADGIQTLYSSKIVVKPRENYIWTKEDATKIFNGLTSNYKEKINIIPKQYEKNNNILVLPIADFHYGLYSDILSTGNDYNLQVAEKSYYQVLNDIKSRVENKQFEKVVYVVGNDFINSDNLSNTTTAGTPQDTSASWFMLVTKATQLIVDGIDMLSTIAPVDVLYVTSNHDLHTMFGIMQTIEAYYRKNKNINIDTSPLPRKYYKFGKTLLSLSHDMKVKKALETISVEAKNDWSECEHIILMLGHLHQAMIYEKQGYLEMMRLPTISGFSRWSNTKGYVQTDKKNQAFIIDGDLGITDVLNTILK